MKTESKPTWAEVRESIKALNKTLDLVEMQLRGQPMGDIADLFEQMFKGKKPWKYARTERRCAAQEMGL